MSIIFHGGGANQQIPAYNDAIKRYKNESRYIGFIDCDEFIVPTEDVDLPALIVELIEQSANAVGLGVNWALYGSSGHEKKEEGYVIERFLKRGEDDCWQNHHVKSIVNPRFVKEYISPHFPLYHLGVWSIVSNGDRQRLWSYPIPNFDIIRCNHYFCKSREEFVLKRNRGMADRQKKYDFSQFELYDLNDVDDTIMLRYVDRIKKIDYRT